MMNNLSVYSMEEVPEDFDDLVSEGTLHVVGNSVFELLTEFLDLCNQGMRWTLNENIYFVNIEKREIYNHVQH